MSLRQFRYLCLAALLAGTALAVLAENSGGDGGSLTGLSSVQVVEQMQHHAEGQVQDLRHYKALRHYQVEYRGYATTINAKMDVLTDYDSSKGMSFQIVSQSGSKFLCDKVLRRAVDSEKEASQDRNSSALTPANYRFQLMGNETIAGRPAYVLDVEPLTASKFLYRGKIWVDAEDFEVVKMESEPAKNPSFFISRTLIHYTSVLAHGFWLPKGIRSETKVRIGGTAVLTIDYGSYEVESNNIERASRN